MRSSRAPHGYGTPSVTDGRPPSRAEGSGTYREQHGYEVMRISLIASAILVGLVNATLYSLIGNNTFGNLFEWHSDPWSLYILYAFSAVFVGLLVSGGLVSFAEEVLDRDFFARYGLLVMAVCVGGAALALFLTTITFLFDPGADTPKQISDTLYTLTLVAVQGAMLGAVEGVVLSLPLSWILGLFEKTS